MNQIQTQARWNAEIELVFEHGARTVLSRRRHVGPLRVQKPFYPEDDVCHLYLLHPPGGMTGHDDLSIDIRVAERARALVTTPAANKAYRSLGDTTAIKQHFTVAGDLEWLPQGMILFGGSRVHQRTEFHLAPCARLLAWDIIALGRPASADVYASGHFCQGLKVTREGQPLFSDLLAWQDDRDILQQAWGLGGAKALGLLLAYPADQDLVSRCRTIATEVAPELRLGVTCVDGLLVVRALGSDATLLQNRFAAIWRRLRPITMQRVAEIPRIWAT
ncbi:MAG: urease accessory protein UreD [Pseudomonadota bacterium]